jgi:peroxiredoxin Q/BCP
VAGCSVDDLAAQKAFSDKHNLRFPLIADVGAEVAKAYDAYKEEWKVSTRTTCVIAEDSTVLKAFIEAPLDGRGHAEHVYRSIEDLV